MSDNVNHPSHYLKAAVTIEPIELTSRLSSCYGQALQYLLRAPYKDNQIEDLEKALFYLRKADDIFDYPKIYSNRPTFSYLTAFRLNHQDAFVRVLLNALFVEVYGAEHSSYEVSPDSLKQATDMLSNHIRNLESPEECCK